MEEYVEIRWKRVLEEEMYSFHSYIGEIRCIWAVERFIGILCMVDR